MDNTAENIFQRTIKYRFKSEDLLIKALMHRSFANENKMKGTNNNERLEFLGDAVLELTISDHVFNAFPDLSEGEMTKLRASVVCEAMLAKIARQIGLGEIIRMGKGEEQSGGRNRGSILSDTMEAVFGAVYLDGGIDEAKKAIIGLLADEVTESAKNINSNDCKTYLQEELQRNSQEPIEYRVLQEKGPDHDKIFIVQLSHGNRVLGTGEGRSKKEAEQSAALRAIEQLGLKR